MGRPKKSVLEPKLEETKNLEVKKVRSTSPKSKPREDASGFRTTISPEHAYKLKMTYRDSVKDDIVVVSESLENIVKSLRDAKSKDKSILHKLKDATLSFFRRFKK